MLNVHYNTISHYTFKQLNNFFHLVKYEALKFCCVRNEKRVAKWESSQCHYTIQNVYNWTSVDTDANEMYKASKSRCMFVSVKGQDERVQDQHRDQKKLLWDWDEKLRDRDRVQSS